MAANPEKLLKRLESLVAGLPEATVVKGGHHASFRVRDKKFAYFLNDHHGDGVICICVKTDPLEKEELIELEPKKYLHPAYISRYGYMSVRLDVGRVDWEEIEERLDWSYRSVAPKKLVKLLP